MRYVKGYSDESMAPGAWGGCWWFFELDADGYPIRQVQRFDNGRALFYDADHLDDEYGGLGDQVMDEDAPLDEIAKAEFEAVWQPPRDRNQS